ncbi:MAG TPA: Ig-like domain-containing protein, partial [Anaerolineales bacterium]|nr:Ig-like domain-containing protein [Anaerolineales bacterium]
MLKNLIHSLVVFGLILTACRPAAPAPRPTPTAQPIANPPAVATPEAVEPTPTEAPRVMTRRLVPNPAAERRPSFFLHFDRPMDAGSVAAALQVEPALDFDLRWENGDTDVYLTPLEPFAPQQAFTVTLAQTAADQAGGQLAAPYTWRHRATALLNGTQIGDTPGPDAPIRIRLNYTLQPWSVERAFSLEPRTEGNVSFDPVTRTLTFTPAVTLTAGTVYTWHIDRPLWDTTGHPILADLQGKFKTAPLVSFATRQGTTGAAIGGGLAMTFSQPVDPASVEAAFSIKPATAGDFTWESANTLVFVPEGGFWAPSTSYTTQIAPTIDLADGRPGLDAPVGVTFRTEAARQLASFGIGSTAQVVDAQGARGVQFAYDGRARTAQVAFTLRAVPLADFVAHALELERPDYGEPETESTLDLSRYSPVTGWSYSSDLSNASKGEDWMEHRLETQLPADVAPGLYVLEMTAGGVPDVLWIDLTSLSIQARQSQTAVLAWVTDINGAPAPGATVTVHAANGQALTSAVSDADGLARLEAADGAGVWVFAELNGDRTVTGLDPDWKGTPTWNWWSQPKDTAVTTTITYITTDRPIYRPGDTLHFKAVARHDDDGALGLIVEKQLTVRLRDARDNIVRTIFLTTDAFGAVDSL